MLYDLLEAAQEYRFQMSARRHGGMAAWRQSAAAWRQSVAARRHGDISASGGTVGGKAWQHGGKAGDINASAAKRGGMAAWRQRCLLAAKTTLTPLSHHPLPPPLSPPNAIST
eukprot:gene13230-biopygen972